MDVLSQERRSDNMRQIRAKHTRPEMIVRRLVHGMGFRYRLHVPDLPGKPDLVFPRWKKIIEIRGCFWHQHSGCVDAHIPKSRGEYWQPKLERNLERDIANLRGLRACGYRVLVLWECQTKNMTRLSARIARFLNA
jgi:DNA mismatch endonuclease (patch repair protein)